jgi:type II secretory pathway component GspD/PulD (secretin)
MKNIVILLLTLLLSSCFLSDTKEDFGKLDVSTKILETPVFKGPVLDSDVFIQVDKVYLVESSPILDKTVNISSKQPINIMAAIDFADNTLSVSPDADVDLNKKFNIKFNNQTLARYFNYLENITGYQIELSDGVVYIRSTQQMKWNLQSLSLNDSTILTSAKTEVGKDTDTDSVAPKSISDNWKQIISHIKTILGSKGIVVDNQQLGTITAEGLPARVKRVDLWLNDLIKSSNRQIHLQVQVLDVTVDESVGRGINWNLISKQSAQFKIGNNAQQAIGGAGIISIGTPAGSVLDLGKKITLDVMLNLLSKQGKVRVDNQPNITVANGREAYITTGDEFSYVASIDSKADAQGQVTTTSNVERMNVGVDMRVTPKILPDGRIAINITPVVSSLKSYSVLTSGSGSSIQEFKTPNIALQKLATQVIVESGKTIHLGGLIASKVANAAKGLPGGGLTFIRSTLDVVVTCPCASALESMLAT